MARQVTLLRDTIHRVAVDSLVPVHAETKPEVMVRTFLPRNSILLLACLFGLPIAAFWAGGRFYELRGTVKDLRSDSKFSQLKWALLAYHDKYKAFPPTTFRARHDGPMHSWRVLLVPHTTASYGRHYAEYNLLHEWNSLDNLQALSGMPYFHYFSLDADKDIANYLAIGDGDEWPSEKPLRSLLVTREKDRFIVVEYPDSDIHWMEPKY